MKRHWRRGIIGGLGFSSALFIFQACYGMPQDFHSEIRFSGLVKSKKTGTPIKGIHVSIKELGMDDITNDEGEFMLFTELIDRATLQFEDADSSENGVFIRKDTLIIEPAEELYLEIELEEK